MAEAAVAEGGMTRREFLYYIWGASMALFTAEAAGLLIYFAIPRFREGQFGGAFPVPVDLLPGVNAPPTNSRRPLLARQSRHLWRGQRAHEPGKRRV